MSTVRLTTAQAVVRFVAAQHSVRDGQRRRLIPAMLGIFGHGNVAGMGQALDQYRDRLPYIQSRNEQSMGHIATAYAKASKRTATLAATSSIGPGSTNLVTSAALATINRLPLLLFPSDTYATRRQGPVLQQLEHPSYGDWSVNEAFRPVARFFDRITRPEQLITALPEAMRILTDPVETGTCVVSLPQDIQAEAYDFPEEFFRERDWEIIRPQPIPDQVERVAALLAGARQPLIIAGGGVIYSGAEQQLADFAAEFGIPVAETFAGKGAVTEDAWWSVGGIGLEGNPATNSLAAQADLVLSIGTRLTDFATASQSIFANSAVRFASINITGHDAHKQGATAIQADAAAALEALRAANRSTPNDDWAATVRNARAEWAPRREAALAATEETPITQGQLIGVMQRHVRAGDTVIAAAGGAPGDMLKVWDATGGRTAHIEFGFSCMGYELPAALGVRLAQPEGQVISFIGDGTFLMQPTELVTAAQERLNITIVISENHGFQVIHRLQMLRAGQEFGNEFRRREKDLENSALSGEYLQLDLAAAAAGLGATAKKVDTADEFAAALAEARDATGPFVIVVPTVPHADLPGAGVWWDVAPAEVSEQDWVRAKRAEYEKDITAQRYYG
ncbi:MAG TPA: 3D-(3,5/4)-trihydroxycyclohexane-1,2-dione acylhydrolase (decyclizing) [Mycobacteriales bacterium]|nr:3D-(3,5/4)-trihydroxycyclohexane-1,2-dione acylhydrolase (decyclizing) [Mycobacteriales bacterium]